MSYVLPRKVSSFLTLKLVVVEIDDLEVLLRDATGGLVLIHTEDGLQHLHHLLLVLVPHGGRGVDADDVVRGLDLGRVVVGGVGVDGDGLVVLRHLQHQKQNKFRGFSRARCHLRESFPIKYPSSVTFQSSYFLMISSSHQHFTRTSSVFFNSRKIPRLHIKLD